MSRMGTSTTSALSSCRKATSVVDTGSTARGNCSARTSPRLAVIDRAPVTSEVVQKEKTMTPTDKKAMKLGMPRLVCSSRPKIR